LGKSLELEVEDLSTNTAQNISLFLALYISQELHPSVIKRQVFRVGSKESLRVIKKEKYRDLMPGYQMEIIKCDMYQGQ
jgi:hypothetical protein